MAPRSSQSRSPAPARKRPKDRRAHIAAAAEEAFGELGFHGVSMEELAGRVGISAAALYRHFPGKYALFREVVHGIGEKLVVASGFDADPVDAEPETVLDARLRSLLAALIALRRSGDLYRWESRYLASADRAVWRTQIGQMTRGIGDALGGVRPELSDADRVLLASTAVSVLGSVADHHAKLATPRIAELLVPAARAVLSTDLPDDPDKRPIIATERRLPQSFKHEVLIREATLLFHRYGYRETSLEEIGATADLPASGVYRYFNSKSDLLAAIFRRAADRVSDAITATLETCSDPEQVLGTLVTLYVRGALSEREVTHVYYAERRNLAPGDRGVLRNIQRLNVEQWAELLVSVRPELTQTEARFLVHAAMGLPVDLGALAHVDATLESLTRVQHLTEVTLFGRPANRF